MTVQKDLIKLNLIRGVEMTILKKHIVFITKLYQIKEHHGERSDQLVEALRYKPEGRGFDSRWVIDIF